MSEHDLTALQERLSRYEGRDYWEALQEAAQDPAFENLLKREFPSRMEAFLTEKEQGAGNDWSVERRFFISWLLIWLLL